LVESTNFSGLENVETVSEAHPVPYSKILGIASAGVKRPRPEAGNSSPFNAEVNLLAPEFFLILAHPVYKM
jgi:hypothetical protein